MKTLYTIIPFALLLLFAACEKESDSDTNENVPDCEKNNTGTIKILNNEDDKYYIYVDDVFKGSIAPNTYTNLEYTAGFHLIKYEQADGYVLYPTVKEVTGTLAQCSEMVVTN